MPKYHLSLVTLFCLLSPLCLLAQTPAGMPLPSGTPLPPGTPLPAGTILLVATPLPRGNVGLGTYATMAQFKNLSVSAGDQVLLQRSLAEGLADFTVSAGQWDVVNGALLQSSAEAKGLNVFTGDKSWTDYTVTVKARKISGREGFSLSFRARDDKNFACLNVGGWTNTKAQFGITLNGNFSEIGSSTPFKVEDNRWYDVKVEVLGSQATGYVDNLQVARATLTPPPPAPPRTNPAPPRITAVPSQTKPAEAKPTGAQPRPAASRLSGPMPDSPPINLPRIPIEEEPAPLATILPWAIFGVSVVGLATAGILYTRRRAAKSTSAKP